MSEIRSYQIQTPLKYLDEKLKNWVIETSKISRSVGLPTDCEVTEYDGIIDILVDVEGDLFPLKEKMLELNIPYDFETEDYNSNVLRYFFRPDYNGGDELVVEAKSNGFNDPERMVPTYRLRHLLELSPEDALKKLKNILEEYDPKVPSLKEYV